jgi:hypothetical protein
LIIIKHRVNTINEIISTPNSYGVEIDLRTFGSEIIIHHDPFHKGVKFSEWLQYYNHKFLVLNVKEDGLEPFISELIKKFKVKNYFFLDQPIPSLFKFSKTAPQFTSVRVSDIESTENALKINASWAWLDSHTGDWEYLINAMEQLKSRNIKMCLVSPELQRTNYEKELSQLKKLTSESSIGFDAVCTKYPNIWTDIN